MYLRSRGNVGGDEKTDGGDDRQKNSCRFGGSFMNYWLLVTHPDNFKVMKAKNIAAMKAKRKSYAEKVEIGDKVVFYLTKIGKFGGAAKFKSKVKEDKSKIF